MSKILISSIRQFGGAVKDCPIYSFQPRKSKKVSKETLLFFEKHHVDFIDIELNKNYGFYPLANKPLICAWAEQNIDTEILTFLDSDVVLFNQPDELFNLSEYDVRLRPVDIKGSGSDGNTDVNSAYWNRLYKCLGVSSRNYITTTVDSQHILAYWNAGHIVSKRSTHLYSQWKQNFEMLMSEKLIPKSGLFFMDQISLAATTSALNLNVSEFGNNYNYPIHLHHKLVQTSHSAAKIEDVISIHYHDLFSESHIPDHIEKYLKTNEKGKWLLEMLERHDLRIPFYKKKMAQFRSYKNNMIFKFS
ncbi:hypothetical protein [Reichenbachiella sp. MALMAid0571]|uniref:hypothetical protein n=1 Tax=Reichenbachiella sp. MALMAid0571 TaxID=3143939 RepID=UPI0032E029C9